MAYKKNYKRKWNRRRNYRRRYPRVTRNRFGPVQSTKVARRVLKYVDTLTLNPGTAGVSDTYVFQLNSLYDPNVSGTGHQPKGFDTYCGAQGGAALYKRYRVRSCHYKVSMLTVEGTYPAYVGVLLSPTSDGYADTDSYYDLGENRLSKTKLIGTIDSNNKAVFSGWSSGAKYCARGMKEIMTDVSWSGDNSNSPLKGDYLILFAEGLGNDTGIVRCMVELTFHCEFFETNDMTTS